MSDPANAPSDSEKSKRRTPAAARRKAWRFVVLFCVYTLSLLTLYRYTLNTELNMWYLFKVAEHTAVLLDLAGDSADVESDRSIYGSGKKRAELEAWREGTEPEPKPATDYIDDAPLSPWETWTHRAYARVHAGESLSEVGPNVIFVESVGLIREIGALRAEIAAIESEASESKKSKRNEKDRLESRLKKLEKTNRDLDPADNKTSVLRNGRRFRFMIVPDCGAIPSFSIFVGAVLAFPVSWRSRSFGLVCGLPVLYFVNLMRLSTLAYIGAIDASASNRWFTFSHEYVWQGIFVVFVVAVWLGWVEFVVRWKQR